jgi:hypothetical protein
MNQRNTPQPQSESEMLHLDLHAVPDGRFEPTSLLWKPEGKEDKVVVQHTPKKVTVSDEIEALRKRIPEVPGSLYDGLYANVEEVAITGHELIVTTSITTAFTHLAASYYYNSQQGSNPVRPLAVQTTLITPAKEILVEKRIGTTDFPNAWSVFGGALKPEEIDLRQAMLARLKKRWGMDLTPSHLEFSGIGRENPGNIYCVFFLGLLEEEQAEKMLRDSWEERLQGNKFFLKISPEEIRRFLEYFPVQQKEYPEFPWNLLGRENVIHTIEFAGIITHEEAAAFRQDARKQLSQNPYTHRYPIEKYL